MLIDSQVHFVGFVDPNPFTEMLIKNEPMLFNNDLGGAGRNGGVITQEFLAALPEEWIKHPLVIDSRVHMLMPGWYPCIPGWHHDDVIRSRSDGQPNYEDNTYRSEHIMMLINADVAPTEFALGESDFDIPPIGRTIYEDWHKEVQKNIQRGALGIYSAMNGHLLKFTDRTWHRGVPAVKNGWRFFIRASRYFDKDGRPTDRANTRTNEVRKQVQIYMSSENAGW